MMHRPSVNDIGRKRNKLCPVLSHFRVTFAPYVRRGSGAEAPRARSGKGIPARYGGTGPGS